MERPSTQPARAPLLILFLTVFIDLLGFGIVIPFLPLYARAFEASGAMIGIIGASYSFMQLFCAPLWGHLSDRVGRKPVLLVSLSGSCLSFLILGLANSVFLIVFSRILAGAAGATIPVAQAYIADSTSKEKRAHGMGLIGAAFGLGFILGPAIGGILSHFGYHLPGLFASALCLANLLAAIALLPESLPQTREAARFFSSPPLLHLSRILARPRTASLFALLFLITFAFAGWEWTFSLAGRHLYGYTPYQVGLLFAYAGMISSITQGGLVGRLVRRFGEGPLILAGSSCMAVGLGLLPIALPPALLLLALALLALGQGLASPVLISVMSLLSKTEEQGEILGVSQSLSSMARILGPLWGGWMYDTLGPTGPYTTGSGVLVGAALLSLVLVRAPVTNGAKPEAKEAVEG